MTAKDIKDTILEFTNDVIFYYGDESACIVPICKNSIDSFRVGWRDNVKTYDSIESLMSDPFFDGKSLNEIAGEIELL